MRANAFTSSFVRNNKEEFLPLQEDEIPVLIGGRKVRQHRRHMR